MRSFMHTSYPSFASSEWQPFIIQSSIQEFQEALPHFSPHEWPLIFYLLQVQPAIEHQEKLTHLFNHISKLDQFNLLGQSLSTASFLAFISFLLSHALHLKVLAPVLMHLPHPIFLESLPRFYALLPIIHLETLLEPLCYQLTLLMHTYESHLEKMKQKIELFKQKIHSIDLSMVPSLTQEIEFIAQEGQTDLNLLETALEIAWQTERTDLIAKLSAIKEQLTHLQHYRIGSPLKSNQPASGLYLLIEHALTAVFDSTLKDEDAALEGLACLKLWNIKDYWEVGLLPQLQYPLDSDVENIKDLMLQVQENLARLNLCQVKDLKRERLFSLELLKHYIHAHQELLIS
jgi:hypothetical protein